MSAEKPETSISFTITLNGYTESQVLDAITARCADQVVERLSSKTDDLVGELLKQWSDEAVETFVKAKVLEELKSGWPQYDQWGREAARVTLGERVTKMLDAKRNWGSSGYGDKQTPERTWLEYILVSTLEALIKDGLKEEVVAARKKFSDMVDAVLQAKVVEVLRGAVGLTK